MPKKSLYAVLVVLMVTTGTCKAELFAPYHQDAFRGFGVHNPIFNLKQLGPIRRGSVGKRLWSDDYWAIYAGGLAFRYANPSFWIDTNKPKPTDWKIPGSHILQQYPAKLLIQSGQINSLSPAEKYDLLVGDTNSPMDKKKPGYSLTRAHIKELTQKTQYWEGSCDGWSFAAINEAPPVKAVQVRNLAGQLITFYPSDIRALLTLLYSKYGVYSFGQLCNEKKPRIEPSSSRSSGRVVNDNCRGLNPGIFHTILINQMGIGKRSLVVDHDATREVWNVPVMSYEAAYYNPVTGKEHKDAFSARVARRDFVTDPNWYHRDKNLVDSVVGVRLKIKYQVENFPLPQMHLDTRHDKAFNDRLTYDLELDAQGNIVGGEWIGHSRASHPDMVSFVSTHDVIRSQFDGQVQGNNLTEILKSIKPEFVASTSSRKRPLFNVVKALARMSQ